MVISISKLGGAKKPSKPHDHVVLTGQRPYEEVPELIAAANVCILPSNPSEKIMRDIVPIKIYEYMGMAKPVITTNLPGIRMEFGEDNGLIYVENPEDVPAMAIELATNNKLLEIGEKARSFVEQKSWDKLVDKFEILLSQAVTSKACLKY